MKRNIATSIILTIVTCGIYAFFWIVGINSDINRLSKEQGTDGFLVIILSLVTGGLYLYYWLYQMSIRLIRVQKEHGIVPAVGSEWVFTLLPLAGLGIVSYAFMQDGINKIVDIESSGQPITNINA